MKIEDESPITFTNEYGVERTYTISEMVGLRETCSDQEYLNRFEICRSCEFSVGDEICTKDGHLIRLDCRLKESSCPVDKW